MGAGSSSQLESCSHRWGRSLLTVGPFVLEGPIARGGMGEVWAGKQSSQGFPVAVKFLTARGFQRPGFRQAFRNEARAVAALDHPHIVCVYGYGEVGAATATETAGRIPAGSPWLALELVTGGTLTRLAGRLSWEDVAHVVRGLLDALAHAHARGVIHRDLKPSNVLVDRDDDGRPVVKLSDFGLAQEVEAADMATLTSFPGGTPAYMAPEQFDHRWRDDGPWTDLYSAGCLFWALVRGQPPFGSGGTFDEKRRQHQEEPLPPLNPLTPVPAGFERWLGRMLEKDPARRFRRAADAAFAFSMLGNALVGGTDADDEPSEEITEILTGNTEPRDPPTSPLGATPPSPSGLLLAAPSLDVPPVPESWRTPDGSERRIAPGMRPAAITGFDAERDAAWKQLVRAATTQRVHAVLLRGPVGSGATRLGEWLVQRAHESGVAHVLRATHTSAHGPHEGLGPMVRSLLRCQGLDRDAARSRIESILRRHGVDDPDVWDVLADLVTSDRASDPNRALHTLLTVLTTERPVVWWVERAPHGIDALRCAAWLMDQPLALPVLVLLTADPADVLPGTSESALLGALAAHDRAVVLDHPPGPPVW